MTVKPPHPPFIEANDYGGKQDVIKWIVLHSAVVPCEIGRAQSVAEFFARETTKERSAHYTVDPTERRQCVPDHRVAYHCGYNYGSIAVEMCEIPSHTDKSRWDTRPHRALETNTAHLVARLCYVYKVRPYYVGPLRLKLGWKGVTTHASMTKAFKQSTHWDPGAWRRRRFMREVRKHYKYIKSTD